MKIQPSELEKHGYTLQDRLEHHELVSFVQTWLKKRTVYALLYIGFNVLALLLLSGAVGYHAAKSDLSFGDGFGYFSYGVLIAFLLVPVHEYIHVLAYRSQGAANTSYDVNWKKLYFMAVADQFVANRREFQMVALAPFAVISTALFIVFLLVNPLWQLAVLGTFFTHTACCGGDFSLLSYFHFHKDREVVTYDDAAGKVSYFFVKKEVVG
ncbi:MAG: DUF3267 domain-containing protein [Saprospiraceae bacterium]|nr:DUF3267 domain-containing protein [Saprospiraceae bacterium]